MTDLAERFARTQGWVWHQAPWGSGLDRIVDEPHWCSPWGQCLAKPMETIDVSILPIIWADCKAKGWIWQMTDNGAVVWPVNSPAFDSELDTTDPIAALCEAYCKAVESAR